MADPFSTAAGAVQIADVALRSAQQIYAFIGDLRSAPEDVRHLRVVLGETEDLMQHIISYMREWQDQSRFNHDYRHLPPSLESAVKWFADDMKQLRNCLPATLDTGFASQVKFVFRGKDIRKITFRLQERKGSMTAVLSTIGRRNDLTLQHDVNTITSSIDVVRRQQTTSLTTVQDAAIGLKQGLSEIHRLRQVSTSQHSQVINRLQSLEATLTSPPTASRASLSLMTDSVPDDSDLISRIVRREIKEALEPFADAIAGRLDSVVDLSAREILRKLGGISDEDATGLGSMTHASTASTLSDNPGLDSGSSPPDTCPIGPSALQQQPADIQLSRTWHGHRSMFGDLEVYLFKFRRRSEHVTRSPEAYFQVRVDFRPAAWITSYGISATYSTAPDTFGYYQICPRILPFRILTVKSRALQMIIMDDVPEFKLMMNKGEIDWFDQLPAGRCRTFLEFALFTKSPGICRFLLRDLGVDASHLFTNANRLEDLASSYLTGMYRRPGQLHDMAAIYPLLRSHLSDLNWDMVKIVSLNHSRLADPGLKPDECLEFPEVAGRGCEMPWAFPWYEMSVLRALPMDEDLSRERWFLDLFLAKGGDPNLRAPRSQLLPLQAALDITTCCLPKKWPLVEGTAIQHLHEHIAGGSVSVSTYVGHSPRYTLGFVLKLAQDVVGDSDTMSLLTQELSRKMVGGDSSETAPLIYCKLTLGLAKRLLVAPRFLEAGLRELSGEETPAENRLVFDEQDGRDRLVLLLPLMESGADVHALVTDWDGERQCSLTDYARGLGLRDIWNRALVRCGYSPKAVEAESKKRLANSRRLYEGNASGIDVSSLELPGLSGLRRRRHGTRVQVL